MDAVQKANSGHPGLPMGAAPMAHALWTRFLRHAPNQPNWPNRDRFILSAGHGSMLLYSLLHLTGYDLSMDEIKNFRQWGSKTPGHPENFLTPGVEMATGPLGQGIATSVGMALAERYLREKYNRPGHNVIDHFTYVIASDGDLMEGVAQEAASLAGHQGLGRLIVLYDDNQITIDGSTELAFTEDSCAKFDALGWHTDRVDGMDIEAVSGAIARAKETTDRPSLIACRTIIGFGSPNKAGSESSHGAALGPEEVRLSKQALGMNPDKEFAVPDDVRAFYSVARSNGEEAVAAWDAAMAAYATEFPAEASELRTALAKALPEGWLSALPSFEKADATRNQSAQIIQSLSEKIPNLLSGCADLGHSVKTPIKNESSMQKTTPTGRNINFGVREHAMAAAVNGMTLHGGVRAFGGTFLIFSDYCRPSLRLSALMECPSIQLFSHDSIGLGEDGPTHQPIEQTMSLRMIPNFNVMRPADGNETSACWRLALDSRETPCALLLSRQNLPILSPAYAPGHPAERGGYVLRDAGDFQAVLIATGSEVALAVEAHEALQKEGIATRVVSLPSWHIFERQTKAYREETIPPTIPAVSIEAGTTMGWHKYADVCVGLDRFGASAPAETLFEEFGFTVANVVATVKSVL
ncbi:MAG: transketolase [Fimbriimonadaceae bacterium]|nr:transketolase [Fimbriimonadaceae bacterium]